MKSCCSAISGYGEPHMLLPPEPAATLPCGSRDQPISPIPFFFIFSLITVRTAACTLDKFLLSPVLWLALQGLKLSRANWVTWGRYLLYRQLTILNSLLSNCWQFSLSIHTDQICLAWCAQLTACCFCQFRLLGKAHAALSRHLQLNTHTPVLRTGI